MDTSTHISKKIYSNLITAILSLQHVIVLFVGIILCPVMLTSIYGLNTEERYYIIFVTTIGAGITTLLQLWKFKKIGLGSPMFMSTSGAFMSCAHAAMKMGGFSLFCTMALLSVPFQVLFSYGIRFMRQLLTPTVGGVIIMLAMVGLLKDSLNTWNHAGLSAGNTELSTFAVGGTVIVIMVLAEWFGRDKLRPWGLFLGICGGTALDISFNGIDLSNLINAAWIGIPKLHLPSISFEPTNLGHWATYFTFIVSMQVASIKYVGDAMALQRIKEPEQRKINFDGIQGGLYANSIGMALTSIAGGMPSSSHSSNIPLMEITGVVSRRIAFLASIMLIVLMFSPKTAYLFAAIPGEVMGGAGVVLVAHLFSTGMRMVVDELDYRNGVIVGLSLSIGLAASNPDFLPDAFPEFIKPLTGNGVAVGGLVAVGLTILTRISIKHNILFYVKPDPKQISYIRNKIHTFAVRAEMSRTQSNYLELACEEIFVHALSEFEKNRFKGRIRYKAYRANRKIFIEISLGSRLDETLKPDCEVDSPEKLKPDELKNLGLIIIGKIVDNIIHQDMGDFSYICFTIPVE